MRRTIVGGVLAVVLLAMSAPASVADTVDPAPLRSFTTPFPAHGVARHPGTGNLYVADDTGIIHVFAPSATGAAIELTAFSQGRPCVSAARQLTFNPAGTELLIGCEGGSLIGRYLVDAAGLLTPTSSIPGVVGAYQASFGPNGLIAAASFGGNAVKIYDLAVSPSTPVATIEGVTTSLNFPAATLMTADGTVYVANKGGDPKVLVFPPGSTGGQPPIRTIDLPMGVTSLESLAMDSAGNLYVGAFTGGIVVYPPGANGAATPLRRLTGPVSGQEGELTQLHVDANRNVYVSELDLSSPSGGRASTFAPLVPLPAPPAAVAPGAVAGLKVAGKKTDKKRTVTWAAGPAGTSPVTSYAVVVTKGTQKLVSTTTTATKLVLKRKKLKKSGKLTVTVTAVSAVGSGPPVSTTMRVKQPR